MPLNLDQIELILSFPDPERVMPYHNKLTSQLGQELFALVHSKFKRNGFFVEFGATDGIGLSNTLLLEREFDWSGILAEPARIFHEALFENRPKSHIETKCVWNKTGEILEFNECGELSTINKFSSGDIHADLRKKHEKLYEVETISIMDLLNKHNAPPVIDYLSIDTEGSEFDILEAIDYDKYDIKIITCEHAYVDTKRNKIYDLLLSKGYTRRLIRHSKWDDWYIKEDSYE